MTASQPDRAHADDPAPAPLSREEEDFLRALVRVLVVVPRAFQADLGAAAGVSFTEYVTLRHLSESPAHSLRMGELARLTALTLGAVTRVVKSLEAKGFVERRRSAADGRGHEARLTQAGRDRLAEVDPLHVASARARIVDRVPATALAAFTDVLDSIGRDGTSTREGGDRGES
ncbi:hypothetical protein Lsed01_00110 [Demequina sediminis]|uniref:HTH marR-type domain-containing protein n=1 Tax=Demequina sediminis TaxID=1930058 RepID=A0ABP9WD01_9MICO|nr:MarR family transcriptional regulator [Demequina sediminis]BDZ60781.1 hypothetical protein GCM10025873_05720 [Demequina sediminis]